MSYGDMLHAIMYDHKIVSNPDAMDNAGGYLCIIVIVILFAELFVRFGIWLIAVALWPLYAVVNEIAKHVR